MATNIRLRVFKVTGMLVMLTQFSCKKFIQIDPPSSVIAASTVYSNDGSAIAVMTGLFSRMSNPPNFFNAPIGINYLMGMAGDELRNYDPTNAQAVQFYTNSLTSGTQITSNYYFWPELYSNIYVANSALEGIAGSSGLSAPIKKQITGEAKFSRAFLYFYATNLYGDIPMSTTTSYLANDSISKSSQTLVYQQIVADLKDAQSNLSAGYLDAFGNPSTEKTRPNQVAATALLARVYLYNREWDNAETQASAVINNPNYSFGPLSDVFLANSSEAIWQLQPTAPTYNTKDATLYVLRGVPGTGKGGSNEFLFINCF